MMLLLSSAAQHVQLMQKDQKCRVPQLAKAPDDHVQRRAIKEW